MKGSLNTRIGHRGWFYPILMLDLMFLFTISMTVTHMFPTWLYYCIGVLLSLILGYVLIVQMWPQGGKARSRVILTTLIIVVGALSGIRLGQLVANYLEPETTIVIGARILFGVLIGAAMSV